VFGDGAEVRRELEANCAERNKPTERVEASGRKARGRKPQGGLGLLDEPQAGVVRQLAGDQQL
jgi:hypothetical protein